MMGGERLRMRDGRTWTVDCGVVSAMEARIRMNTKEEAFYFEQMIDGTGG